MIRLFTEIWLPMLAFGKNTTPLVSVLLFLLSHSKVHASVWQPLSKADILLENDDNDSANNHQRNQLFDPLEQKSLAEWPYDSQFGVTAAGFFQLSTLQSFNVKLNVSSEVSGLITGVNGSALSNCTITLKKVENGLIVAIKSTDFSGKYIFNNISPGNYFLEVVHVGYTNKKSDVFSMPEDKAIVLPTILLVPSINQLEQVSIVAKKPLFDKRLDKTIVNVDNSALATGGSVIDILEISPGVTMDNNQLTLMGKQGVTVTIDDKVVKLSGAQVISLLQSMPAGSVDKIELIANPSAKYDAEGKGGVINIKTKKGANPGFNGTISSSAVLGKNLRPGGGLLLNYKFKRLNLFANYNYQHVRQTTQYLSDKIISGRTPSLKYFQDETSNKKTNNQIASLGADFNMNDNNVFGITVNTNTSRGDGGFVQDVYFGSIQPALSDSSIRSLNLGNFRFSTQGIGLNSKHSFSNNKQVLQFDATYTAYRSENSERFVNSFFTIGRLASANPEYINNHSSEKIDLIVIRADYSHSTDKIGNFGAGLKTAFTRSNGSILFQSKLADVFLTDNNRTNQFDYDETISAAYVNYTAKIGKTTDFQAGIRAEHTIYSGFSPTNGQTVGRKYLQFFPSISILKAINENSVGLSYSRRVGRPSYEDLNPFISYSSPYFYTQGNPLLVPETTNSFELSYGYHNKLNTSVGFSRTSHYYNYFTSLAGENGATKQTVGNFNKYDSWYLSVNYNDQLADWWSINATGDLSYDRYQTPYLNELIDVRRASYSFQALNSFKLKKDLTFEVIGLYRSKRALLARTIDMRYRIDAALKYAVLKSRMVIKTGVTDIFYSYINKGTNQFANLYGTYYNRNENRRFNLSVSYKFGGGNATSNKKQTTVEELDRIK